MFQAATGNGGFLPERAFEFFALAPVNITLEPDRPERILEWIIGEQYDCGITDGFEGHPAIDSKTLDVRTVCIFPKGHRFSKLKEVLPEHFEGNGGYILGGTASFFQTLSDVFRNLSVSPKLVIETRQFTGACELVALGVGVSVVSELDARTYQGRLEFRPFAANVPHKLSLVRPVHEMASMITLDFMEAFQESLKDLVV